MTEPAFENVRYEVRDRVAWITIDRPAKLNALDGRTVREIDRAAERARAADDVAVIVLTGAGDKAFVAGADIAAMAAMGAREAQLFSRFLQGSLDRLEASPKPVIAAINGFALGGGLELAMACHLRICAAESRLGQPEINLALIPGAGGTQRLQRLVGRGRALDLVLGGDMIDAEAARAMGLVERVVPRADLAAYVQDHARKLAEKSPLALARALEAVLAGGEMAQHEAMQLEAALFGLSFATEDMREGTRAFLEKRKPKFGGR
jgi:enoyl-CoA hydratase